MVNTLKSIAALCLILLFAEPVLGDPITLVAEDYRPFQYYDENSIPQGFCIELLKTTFDKAGIGIKDKQVLLLPWSLAYRKARYTKNTAVFLTARNQQRENLFKWVGPLAAREMWLYKLKERKDIQLETLADAKKYRIGGIKNGAETIHMINQGLKVLMGPAHGTILLQLLINGKVDLIPSLEISIAARLHSLGLDYELVELDNQYNYYLALNKETSDDTVKKLQQSLDELKRSGFYDELWQRYMRKN
jgi:polar amino acid transport system substrate-binding protein